MYRRRFLGVMAAGAAGLAGIASLRVGWADAETAGPEGAAADGQAGAIDIAKIDKSEAEWRAQLSEQAFQVLRKEATERPGSSELNAVKAAGTFVCVGCELPLFKSEWKFESGTGWPSFYTYIDGHLGFKTDYKMVMPRTEYHCARCGGHQGHVFNDGPQPTGKRYCNNGVALNFRAADPAAAA